MDVNVKEYDKPRLNDFTSFTECKDCEVFNIIIYVSFT